MFRLSQYNSKFNHTAEDLHIPKRYAGVVNFPAGITCPGADICHAWNDRVTGRITKGIHADPNILCWAAKIQAYATDSRRMAWENYDALKGRKEGEITDILLKAIPDTMKIIRVPCMGDFWDAEVYYAFCNVAQKYRNVDFTGYTKTHAINEWRPPNFRLEYSHGGKHDREYSGMYPTSYIIKYWEAAEFLGVPIVCNKPSNRSMDHKLIGRESFALFVH